MLHSWSHSGACPTEREIYSAKLISSDAEITRLAGIADPLLSSVDVTLQLPFFSASIAPNWVPRIVSVQTGDAVVGIVYAKERKFAGILTGIIYADASLGKMVVARPEHFENVLCVAVRALFDRRGTRAMRLLVSTQAWEFPTLERLLSSLPADVRCVRTRNHSILALAPTYDRFLQLLGYHTRQDFRRYRRRFEAGSGKFIERLSLAEYEDAASHLLNNYAMKSEPHEIKRAAKILSVVDQPMISGLQRADGEWVSIVGGWYESDRAVVLSQLNSDKKYPHAQLSIVLRGYVIEKLIETGVRNVVFWGGLGGPLIRYSKYVPSAALHVDKRDWSWRALRGLFQIVRPLLPQRMHFEAEWITPRAAEASSTADFALVKTSKHSEIRKRKPASENAQNIFISETHDDDKR